jgi:hypothetical protein
MEALESKWRSLFRKAAVEMSGGLSVAEEGYYLFAVPSLQKGRTTTALHQLQSRLPNVEEGVSLTLNKQKELNLILDHDYHQWARDYAGKIDANEIRAETMVDLAVFLRRLRQLAGEQGLGIWREEQDKQFVEVICDAFRQPVNLYVEVAHMVLSAKPMTDQINVLLRDIMRNCRMLLDYFQKFVQIFSGYRVFVGDHHFVVCRGEHDLAPGFNYWSLLDDAVNKDQTFWQGVSAIKEFLRFTAQKRKEIH